MTTKYLIVYKYSIIFLCLAFLTTSCEKDFENVGGELVDNGAFNTLKRNVDVIAYSKNIDASRVDNISILAENKSQKLTLGVYNTPEFGNLKAHIVSQVLLPTESVDWGDSPQIDAVYLEIPYDATKIENFSDGKPQFELNNVFGNINTTFPLKISKLTTFLNSLNPLNPSESNSYYSNDTFNTSDVLAQVNFQPMAQDTMLVFERELLQDATHNYDPHMVNDTIKKDNENPFLKIELDKMFFETNFVSNLNQVQFEDQHDFLAFFNGIVMESEGTDGSIMSLDLSSAAINIYYTNTETKIEDETTVDLNNNGNTTDTNVSYPVRTKKTMTFPLSKAGSGIKTNVFNRDYAGANAETFINSPNVINGEKKLYLQGAAGSMIELDLFHNTDLNAIRDENWLITEASLTFYIDQNASGNTVPERLLLYKVDPDNGNTINENSQLLDAITQSNYFNGFLQNDSIDDDANALKYKVNITDYISKILKQEDFNEPEKLGLKIYDSNDIPQSETDTLIEDFSWDPRGVVLFGNDYISTDANFDKRIKLEIHYTKINE
ncbi:MAG: DUF4270 domain-containing protein [Flavobacteriaceae bacterium]